ncbi:hypothetical protein GGD63_006523 [Bradyrhizobium sp. cir1]|nr:hypothetical protein [Bradyrhizobium sp. cir1]
MPDGMVVQALKWADIQERRREGHIFFGNHVLTVAWLSRRGRMYAVASREPRPSCRVFRFWREKHADSRASCAAALSRIMTRRRLRQFCLEHRGTLQFYSHCGTCWICSRNFTEIKAVHDPDASALRSLSGFSQPCTKAVRSKTSRAVGHGELFQSVTRRFNARGTLAWSLLSQQGTTASATPRLPP